MGLGIHLVPVSTCLGKMIIFVEECKLSLPIREKILYFASLVTINRVQLSESSASTGACYHNSRPQNLGVGEWEKRTNILKLFL